MPPAPSVLRRRGRPAVLSLAVALLLAGGTLPCLAGEPGAGTAAAAPEAPAADAAAERAAGDSPRAAVTAYLELCRAGRFDEAARYLDLPDDRRAEGPQRARQLKAVLDRHAWIDLAQVSPLPGGNEHDGLAAGTDELARIPGPGGRTEPVRLVHRAGAGWVFSRATVERIDAWYGRLPNRWTLEYLPEPLLRPGPGDLLWWQWLALPLVVLLSWLIGRLLGWITRTVIGRLAEHTRTEWDDILVERISGPLTVAWSLLAAYLIVPRLGLYQPAQALINRLLHGGFLLVVFWSLMRAVDLAARRVALLEWARERPSSRQLIMLGGRVVKAIVLGMAVIAVLAELGYPVASLVAGLGIGGLALALAAQKTVENLFGAFSLGVDQPFREGDFVKVEDFVGTVERVGLRSTRVRTLDRTLVTIPNGRLADMRLESFTARDRIRLACTVGLVYETTAAQMREVLAGLERVLREHPKIWPDAVVVRFSGLGAYSLDIDIMAWFQTPDWGEFQGIRQEVLLSFMDVVEKAGTSFAFPTQTLHVAAPEVARAERVHSAEG